MLRTLRVSDLAIIDELELHFEPGLNALTAFVIRAASAGIMVLMQVFLARWLGAHEFGVFATAWVWVTVLGTLATLGLASSVVRHLPVFRQQGDFSAFRGFLRVGHVTALAAGTCVMLAGWLMIWLWPGMMDPGARLPTAIALLALPAYAACDFQDGVGRAQGWIATALIPPYALRPLLILMIAGLCLLGGFPAAAATALAAAAIAAALTTTAQYMVQRHYLNSTLPPAERTFHARPWIMASLPFLMLEGLSLAMLNLDVLILNLYAAPADIGVYLAAGRVIALVSFVHFAVTAVAMPRFAALQAAGRDAEILPFLRLTQTWTFLPTAAGAAVLLLIGKPALALFGPEFIKAYPLMFVFAAGLMIRALAGPAQSLLMAAGHQRTANLIVLAAVLAAAALHLILIPRLGPTGAAFAVFAAFAIESAGTLIAVNRLFPAARQSRAGA